MPLVHATLELPMPGKTFIPPAGFFIASNYFTNP